MNTELLLCIAGMALVTALPRVLPISLLAGKKLPPLFLRWLSFVPVCVLASLLAPEILVQNGSLNLGPNNVFLLASIPAGLAAWRFNSFFAPIALGMVCVALGRFLGLG